MSYADDAAKYARGATQLGHLRHVIESAPSGRSGTLRSLHQFMQRADHDLAVRLWDGDIDLHVARTPEGHRFRLLNLPFFLVHQLGAYLDWADRESC